MGGVHQSPTGTLAISGSPNTNNTRSNDRYGNYETVRTINNGNRNNRLNRSNHAESPYNNTHSLPIHQYIDNQNNNTENYESADDLSTDDDMTSNLMNNQNEVDSSVVFMNGINNNDIAGNNQ